MPNPLTNMFKAIPVPQYFKKGKASASTSTAEQGGQQAGQTSASGASHTSSSPAPQTDHRARTEEARRQRGRFSLNFGKKKKNPVQSGAFQPGGANSPAFQQKLAQLRNRTNPDVPGPSNTNGSETASVSGSEQSYSDPLARFSVSPHAGSDDEVTNNSETASVSGSEHSYDNTLAIVPVTPYADVDDEVANNVETASVSGSEHSYDNTLAIVPVTPYADVDDEVANNVETASVSGSEHSYDNSLALVPVIPYADIDDEVTSERRSDIADEDAAVIEEFLNNVAGSQHFTAEETAVIEDFLRNVETPRSHTPEETAVIEAFLNNVADSRDFTPEENAVIDRLLTTLSSVSEQSETSVDGEDLQRLFHEEPESPVDGADLQRLFRESHVEGQVINPKTKEVKPEELKRLSAGFQEFLDGASDTLGASAATALRNTLTRLDTLADESAGLVRQLDAMPAGEDKDIAKKLEARHLGEAVRDCYARAAKICEKHAAKAENGSDRQTKLAAMSAMFSELKRHHLSATATPAFEAHSKMETKFMKHANPGMVDMRSGALVFNAKAVSLDVTFGKDKITKADPLKITGEAGMELEETEEMSVDDDGDQNRWDRYSLSARLAAVFDGGVIGGKLGGKLKVSLGTNYGETGSFPDQSKMFTRQKNEDALINKLSDSAGPNARKLKEKYKDIQKTTKKASAADQISGSAPTHLTMQKVGKGANNTSVIHEMAKKVDPQLANLMKEAYLPLERPMNYAGTSVPAGGAGQRGKEKVSITYVEGTIEGSMKVAIPKVAKETTDYLSAGLTELKGALVGRRKEFDVERLKPSHVLLSGGYTKDMRKSLDLWNAIENGAQDGSRLKAKLGQYDRVKEVIANVTGDHDPETPYDAAFFGPVTDIPKPFLNTILTPEDKLGDLANAIATECERLGKDYASFQENAGILNAVGEKRANQLVKNHYASLHDGAFKKINESAWGNENGSGARLTELVSSSRKRSEFLADSYDALSTALGGAGTHLEILKAKVAEMDNPPAALIEALNKADEKYSQANATIMKAEIPLHEDTLHRYSTIAWTAVSSKNEVEGQFSLTAGGQPNIISNAMTQEETEVTMSLDTAALGLASASLIARNLTADHPNLTRGGDFREVHLTLGAGPGPLTGQAMEKAVIAAVKKMRKDLDGVDISPSEIAGLKDTVKTVMSGAALDGAKNVILSWKYHKFSKAGDSAYRQQYFRLAEQGKENFSATISIPTQTPGVTVKPGVRVSQDRRNPLYEMMGSDLSHHLLSYVRLADVEAKANAELDRLKKNQAQAAANGAEGALAQGEELPDKFTLLMEEFDAAPFRKNQFFSTNAILDVVKDYKEFAEWKKGSPGVKQPDSGFVYYDRAEIQDVVKNARKVESLAAGKSSFSVTADEAGNTKVEMSDKRPSLSDPLANVVNMDDLEEFEGLMQERLAQKRNADPDATLTPDDRMDLLLNTDQGKKIFESYKTIVTNYRELNATASTLAGYDGHLREESSTFQRTERAGLAIKNAGAALLSTFDGNDLQPSPGAGTAAESVLDQRGYFAEGTDKDYDHLPQDNQSLEQTNTWLARHGLVTADNGLTGMHSLIVAHLQHTTGRYDSLHVDEAAKYLKQLGSNTPSEEQMQKVIEEINREHGAVQARMIAPGAENNGAPAWTGDLGASQQNADRSVVIMRSKNDRGDDTFAAVVQRKGHSAPDIPEHLKKLDQAQAIRTEIVTGSPQGQNSALTGIELRQRMQTLGAQPKNQIEGLLASPVKNATEALANMKSPERPDLRKMDTPTLKTEIQNAAQLRAGSTHYFKEAVKELKNRDGMKNTLTGAAAGSSLEQKTGKELRKERENNLGTIASLRMMASRLKPKSEIDKTMARLTGDEVQSIAETALHPKIKKAAEKEVTKRDKMTSEMAQQTGQGRLANLVNLQGELRALARSNQMKRMTEGEQQKVADKGKSVISDSSGSQTGSTMRNRGIRINDRDNI